MKEEFIALGAVTSHSRANKIYFYLQGLLSKKLLQPNAVSYQYLHFVFNVHFSVLGFSRDKQDNVTLGAHHRAHWLEHNTFYSGTTCRGLGSGQQTQVVGWSSTAGSTQQWPLMSLHTAK